MAAFEMPSYSARKMDNIGDNLGDFWHQRYLGFQRILKMGVSKQFSEKKV